jgi:hypothetical protein
MLRCAQQELASDSLSGRTMLKSKLHGSCCRRERDLALVNVGLQLLFAMVWVAQGQL